MQRFLLRLLLNVIALTVIAYLIPGISVRGLGTAILAALVLGLVNAVVRPILVLLTLPVTLVTLGLFLLIINAAMFALAAALVPGFHVNSFGAALAGSILYSIAGWLTSRYLD